MEDRDTEIEKLKKELANLKKDPRELILASRIREREEEYQHRLLELELASEGIIPVGIAPEAKAHGGKEFTALMKEVEVDEVSGQFIAILGCVHSENLTYIFLSLLLSFILFRFFDITKIGPIKKFEKLPNGIGIMADDIVAGLFAFITQAAILTSLNQNIYIKTLWN